MIPRQYGFWETGTEYPCHSPSPVTGNRSLVASLSGSRVVLQKSWAESRNA